MKITRMNETQPNWDIPKAKEPGFMRHISTYFDEESGATNGMVGLVHQPPGNSIPGLHTHGIEETYFVLQGEAAVWTDDEDEIILEENEAAFFPPGEEHGYRNVGHDNLVMLWVLSGSEADMRKEGETERDETTYDM